MIKFIFQNVFLVTPGSENIFTIYPKEFINDLKESSIEKRGCLLPTESFSGSLSVSSKYKKKDEQSNFVSILFNFQRYKDIFKRIPYSQNSCYFECKLKIVASRVNCLPWNFPPLEDTEGKDTPICNFMELQDFWSLYLSINLENQVQKYCSMCK